MLNCRFAALVLLVVAPVAAAVAGTHAGAARTPRDGVRVAHAAALTLQKRPLPPIVFVSRAPLAERGAIPGLGPHHRAAAPGGRLMLQSPDGAIRPLLGAGVLWDCSDPAPSPDGKRIAFAGTVHPD